MKWLLILLIVACTVASDVLQSHEMKRHGEIIDFRVRSLTRALGELAQRRYLILSIACMALSFFAFLRLLQITTLSFSVPATALTYVVDALFARYVLHEHLSWRRWAGIVMIAGGVISVSW
ncbi:MAG: EamA family transporter [Bryobacteraceae bacterium]